MSDTFWNPTPSFMQRLAALRILLPSKTAGAKQGDHTAKCGGGISEFKDYRVYFPGDDIRYLDWNIYGRLERLIIKEFTREEDRRCILLIDASGSMDIGRPNKFRLALQVAVAVAYIALASRYSVRLGYFSEKHVVLSPKFAHLKRLSAMTAFLATPRATGMADLRQAMLDFRKKSAPCSVLMISDLLTAEKGKPALRYLASIGYRISLLHLMAWEEARGPEQGHLTLKDKESGQRQTVYLGARVRRQYQQRLMAFRADWRRFCRLQGLRYLFATTEGGLEKIVLQELRRARWVG